MTQINCLILSRLIDEGAYHELLLDLAKTLQTRLELEVVVGRGLGDGRDNGDPVALRADIVGR